MGQNTQLGRFIFYSNSAHIVLSKIDMKKLPVEEAIP